MADATINPNSNNYKAGVTATKVGTATAAQVLTGKTFTNSSSVGISGTMVNNGAWTNAPTTQGKVAIPAGYHNGNGYIDTSNVGYRIKTGTVYFSNADNWHEENIGGRPEMLIVYFYYVENGTLKYYHEMNQYYSEVRQTLDSKYIQLTDTGFKYKANNASVALAYLQYAACY